MIDPFAPFRLDGRVAIVTGASSGFGDRFARVLAAAGARVVVAARRLDRLEKLAAEVEGTLAVVCDVARPEDNQHLIETTLQTFGRIDVLVNNAGASDAPARAESESLELFSGVMKINLDAIFHLSSLAAPTMIAQGKGSIVNVSSIHGLVASAPNRQAAYAASKGAVLSLTRELAVQWARKGVRVNALAPAYFNTELTAPMFEDVRSVEWITRNTPLGRAGEMHELDGALLFLASDASSFVTGSTLTVDGGWTAR